MSLFEGELGILDADRVRIAGQVNGGLRGFDGECIGADRARRQRVVRARFEALRSFNCSAPRSQSCAASSATLRDLSFSITPAVRRRCDAILGPPRQVAAILMLFAAPRPAFCC